MPSPNIIIPGAPVPSSTPSIIHQVGGTSFSQGEPGHAVTVTPVHLAPGQKAADVLIGNPAHKPFAVAVPWLLGRVDTDMKWTTCFLRGADPYQAVHTACMLWERYLKPEWYPREADWQGKPMGQALDEQDWKEAWISVLRLHKQDERKHPLIALGVRGAANAESCPYFFALKDEDMSFSNLQDAQTYGQVIVPGSFAT